jgi:SAM-dependent methyltransferase
MFYGADLAHVHHEGFGEVARAAAATLADELGDRRGLVVDLACGTGITARALTDKGHEVLGVDISPGQLAIAREHAPDARFEEASLATFEPPPCLAVAIIGEGLSYAGGIATARTVIERVHKALEPGGLLLFDVVEPGREEAEPRRSWTEGDGWLVCVEASEHDRVLNRRILTLRRGDDGSWRRSDEHHVQYELDPDELLAHIEAIGFEVRRLPGYGDEYRFTRGTAGFLATKP